IEYATTEQRARVVYDNEVAPDALSDLTITKKLFDVTGEQEITEEEDKAVFDFRLYLATESGDINNSPANMHTYHVKDTQGNYCFWSVEQQRIVPLGAGKTDYTALTDDEKEATTFHTSMNGSITKIPVGYTIEVRDLLVGTKFKVVERPTEVPDGYSFKKYVYNSGEYTDALAGVVHTIEKGESTQNVEVDNVKGFGLRVNKKWSDELFMSDRDPVYFGVFCKTGSSGSTAEDWQLVEGSLRRLAYGTSSVYWYYDQLPGASSNFEDYAIYEVTLTDPEVDENNIVTSYAKMQILEEGAALVLSGKQTGDAESSQFTYAVSYDRGETTTNDNVRVDTVNNTRPGIILKKAQWDGTTPLAGAEFTLTDTAGTQIGTFTSDAEGMIAEVFLRENTEYTLTETKTPQGWHAPEAPMQITLNSKDHTVTITGVDEAYYTITYPEQTAADGKTTITVKNRPYAFQAVKMDKGTAQPLAGVEFALYRLIKVGQVESWDPNPYPGFEKIKSGRDGVLPGLDNTLPAGTYELRETKPLSGYPSLSHHTAFTITQTGAVTPYHDHAMPEEAKLEETVDEATGTVQYTLTITNAKTFPVSIWKTDLEDHVLSDGASFSLYDEAGYDAESGKPKTDAKPVVSGTTGENGLLALGTLQVGTYYLVETEAPAGYNLLNTAIVITVKNDDVAATLGAGGESLTVNKKGDKNWVKGQDNKTLQIQVKNTPGSALPVTGGMGTKLFVILGSILAVGAALLLWRRRRYCER
ncbi:MAG: LPXTG cell wall anchor domain-containing protein, partial [Eubacterium sp.]|nr:LPXTG cell wall anchor domain-containing protein [Eubacterium sp.]